MARRKKCRWAAYRRCVVACALVASSLLVACGSSSGSRSRSPGASDIGDGDASSGDAAGFDVFSDSVDTDTEPSEDTDGEDTSRPDADAASDECVDNGDCAGGELCVDGACRAACRDDADCAAPTPRCSTELRLCVECLESADCDDSERCVDAACRLFCTRDADCSDDRICAPDSGRCVEPECSESADCPGGTICTARRCIPIEDLVCEPGSVECEGDLLITCSADGRERTETDCAPDASCVPGAAGGPRCVERVCVPNTRLCVDDEPFRCSPDGTSRVSLGLCDAEERCVGGECRPEACEPGERSCSGDILLTCDASSGEWIEQDCTDDEAYCGETDAGPRCRPWACTPEDFRCTPDGGRERCDARGTDWLDAPCPAGTACVGDTCAEVVCTPGTRRCASTDVEQCADDGTGWERVATCASGCTSGMCRSGCVADGHLGCAFVAADLENVMTPCSVSADCSGVDDSCTFFEPDCCGADGYCVSSEGALPAGVRVANPGDRAATVTIYDADGDRVDGAEIAAGESASFELPRAEFIGSGRGPNTFRVESNRPVSVAQHNPLAARFSSDGSLLLPAGTLGTDYTVVGWDALAARGETRGFRPFVTIANPSAARVLVRVTPTAAIESGEGSDAYRADVTSTIRLEGRELITLAAADEAGVDLTGTRIEADAPVAVFSGTECGNVPVGNSFCDHLEEQLLPDELLGTDYLAARFVPRGEEPDVWRVVATRDGTTIETTPAITGLDGVTLDAGEHAQAVTSRSFAITATAPVAVGHYAVGSSYPGRDRGCDTTGGMTSGCAIPRTCESGSGIGDPAFAITIPRDRFRTRYTVWIPPDFERGGLTITRRELAEVSIAGASAERVIVDVPGDDWIAELVELPPGEYVLSSDEPFGVVVHGYACDASFAHPGGLGGR